ncbi:uncharacterized protein LOC141906273 [Tubulanus polymorphus]|uniref:uncharacterized protein LOC141906273 n=1 Tax=Tubulanus polymorphus TaxID=672921 RepID=UPI003DA5A315
MNRSTIDAWIDDLVEGMETVIGPETVISSLEEAVVKMQIDQDLPKVELTTFDGSALQWPRFIEQFHAQIHCRPGIKDTTRMDALQTHVKGEAKKLIQGLGFSGKNYARSLKELKFVFGHRVHVARAHIDSITNGPVVNPNDSISLRNFYIPVRDCLITLNRMNYTSEISSSDLLQKTVKRLPIDKRSKWNDFARRIYRQRDLTLVDLENWLKDCVDADFGPFSLQSKPRRASNFNNESLNKSKSFVLNSRSQTTKCILCSENHNLSKCRLFLEKPVEQRFTFVKSNRLCINCLAQGHYLKSCLSTITCKETECGKKHHILLHNQRQIQLTTNNSDNVWSNSGQMVASGKSDDFQCNIEYNTEKVLPIIVQGKNGRRISTYGLLDSGSDITMIQDSLAADLGLPANQPNAEVISISRAWTTSGQIHCPLQKVNETGVKKLAHLNGIDFSEVLSDKVQVLLGANVPQVHLQLEVREGTPSQPVAKRTKLGWCLLGDEKSLAILTNSTHLVNGHYEVGMLWRDEDSVLPNNFHLAHRRFGLLMDRLEKDEIMKEGYSNTLNGYISDGYAQKLSPEEAPKDKVETIDDAVERMYKYKNKTTIDKDSVNRMKKDYDEEFEEDTVEKLNREIDRV